MFLTDLYEEVFASLAIGYHRTRNLKNANAIGDSGFKIGERGMYGPGIYLTYDFDDQQDEYMTRMYGPFVVRCKVNLSDFMIFDPEVAMRVYPGHGSVAEQLAMFGTPRTFRPTQSVTDLTSDAARGFAAFYLTHKTDFKRPVKGLVFTGAHDGRVIVAFDPTVVTAYSWARVINLAKTKENIKWHKFDLPTAAPANAQAMPKCEQAYRYLRTQGFRLLSKGPVGAQLLGEINGLYVTIKIKDTPGDDAYTTITAFATRQLPTKLPGYADRAGYCILSQHYKERIPLNRIVGQIVDGVTSLNARKTHAAAFASGLLKLLTDHPVAVQNIEGRDLRADQTMLTAGAVHVVLDSSYHTMVTGKLDIRLNKLSLRLHFGDGTRDNPTPSVAGAYASLLQSVSFMSYAEKKYFTKDIDLRAALTPICKPGFIDDLLGQLATARGL